MKKGINVYSEVKNGLSCVEKMEESKKVHTAAWKRTPDGLKFGLPREERISDSNWYSW